MTSGRVQLSPFDPAAILTSDEAIAGFLRLSLEEDSPEELAESLEAVARARKTLRDAKAAEAGRERRPTVAEIISSIGYKLVLAPLTPAA